MPKLIDLTGRRFGRIRVIDRAPNVGKARARWNCVCDCGAEFATLGQSLTAGLSRSCGCLHRDKLRERQTRHGDYRSPLYGRWQCMVHRCTNPKNKYFANYGERGITVCERWRDYVNFRTDMGGDFRPDYELDRIDNDGDYSPENCRWVHRLVNMNNKRNTRHVMFDGVLTPVAEVARYMGEPYHVIAKWAV